MTGPLGFFSCFALVLISRDRGTDVADFMSWLFTFLPGGPQCQNLTVAKTQRCIKPLVLFFLYQSCAYLRVILILLLRLWPQSAKTTCWHAFICYSANMALFKNTLGVILRLIACNSDL